MFEDITGDVGSGRVRVVRPLRWPEGRRRTPSDSRDGGAGAPWDFVVGQLGDWLETLHAGRAELSVGRDPDPGAALRFTWRGRRFALAADTYDEAPANVGCLLGPLQALHSLSQCRQPDLLGALLVRIAEAGDGRDLPLFEIDPKRADDDADSELASIGDALAEAAVAAARGERCSVAKLEAVPGKVFWSVRQGALRALVETPPAFEKALRIAAASLGLEPWARRIAFEETLRGTRWRLSLDLDALGSMEGRAWVSAHTWLRERRPEIRAWLEEGGR